MFPHMSGLYKNFHFSSFVWINPVRIMYRVFPFEQTDQWWSFVWSCLTLKFSWQERTQNSDILCAFAILFDRKLVKVQYKYIQIIWEYNLNNFVLVVHTGLNDMGVVLKGGGEGLVEGSTPSITQGKWMSPKDGLFWAYLIEIQQIYKWNYHIM